MSNQTTPLACPFAKPTDPNGLHHVWVEHDGDLCQVACNCGAYGPFENTEAGAIESWNTRASRPLVKEPLTTEQAAKVECPICQLGDNPVLAHFTATSMVRCEHGSNVAAALSQAEQRAREEARQECIALVQRMIDEKYDVGDDDGAFNQGQYSAALMIRREISALSKLSTPTSTPANPTGKDCLQVEAIESRTSQSNIAEQVKP